MGWWLLSRLLWLENDQGDYPWQTVRWGFGIGYFAGIPAAYFLLEGDVALAALGAALGTGMLLIMALVAWRWSI